MKLVSLKTLFICIAPVLLFAFTTKADRANFSGSWKLNESKSELGEFARFAPKLVKATQTTDSITVSRTAPSFSGDDVTVTETLYFNGKPTETPVFGTSKRISTVKWSDDGQTMTITYKIELDFGGQTSEITGSDVWTLADGGKSLVINTKASSPQGDLASKTVLDKQ